MAKIKLVIGKKYIYKWDKGQCELTYNGIEKDSNYTCSHCGRERWNVHEFITGSQDNPTCVEHFGIECVKACIFEID